MEQVFDFREFVFSVLRRIKLMLILGAVLGVLGAGCGVYSASSAGGGEETFTATSAAAVNLRDGGEIPYWTLSNIMATIDAVSGSDFTYANFAEELAAQGLSQVLPKGEDISAADIKTVVKFYCKGNLLLADVTTGDRDLSSQASQCAIAYLSRTVPQLLNHVEIVPLDRQTVSLTTQPAPSKLRQGLKFGLLGAAGGIVLGLLWGFFFDVFDLKVRSERDLQKYGVPVLGVLDE